MAVTNVKLKRKTIFYLVKKSIVVRLSILSKLRLISLLLIFNAGGLYANDYYWIGNSGNWNNSEHWSTTDNGKGGAGIPGSKDNVHFIDDSPLSSIQIEINQDAFCKSFISNLNNNFITFIGNGTATLSVFGNFFAGKNTFFQSNALSAITLKGSKSNAHINLFDHELNTNLIFNGKKQWFLDNNLGLSKGNSITFLQGNIITNNYGIIAGSILSTGNLPVELTLGNSLIYISNELDLETNTNLTVNYGSSVIYVNPDMGPKKIKPGKGGSSHTQNHSVCGNLTVTMTITSDYNGSYISCNDSCDGEITITVSSVGGGPYSYQFNGVGGYTAQTVYSSLCAGNYTISVTDSSDQIFPGIYNVCTENINLNEPGVLTLNVLGIINPTCPDSCDGEAILNTGGGTPGISINWPTSGETGNHPTQLCLGWNNVILTDTNGCLAKDSVKIIDPPVIQLNIVPTDVSCNGVCDGFAVSSPSGGNGGPWTYNWATDPISGDGTDSIYSLCAGNYSLNVTDNVGCPQTANFAINEPPPLVISITSVINNVCSADCLGSITISPSSGTPPYSYQWYDCNTGLPIPGETNPTISNACNGAYQVQVTDAGGCSLTSPCQAISSPPLLTVSTSLINDATCNGYCDGSISATPSGGTGAGTYSYLWYLCGTSTSTGFTSSTPATFCAGSYFVIVTDANGCQVQSSPCDSVSEPQPIVVTTVPTDVICFGQCNGQITSSISGGTTPYAYDWQNCTGIPLGVTTDSVINLCPGQYLLEVTDVNGCVQQGTCDTIIQPNQINYAPVVTDVTCNGSCDGTVTANTTGGVTPYSMAWYECGVGSIGQNSDPAINLCAGLYQIVVTDFNGCIVSSTCQTVTEPTALTTLSSSTTISCGGACDGTATVSTSGGTTPYSYQWYDCSTGLPLPGATNPTVNNLCPGDYQAIVTDANSCTDTTSCITFTDPPILSVTAVATDELCFGDCLGTTIATPAGGTPPYTYQWYDCSSFTPISSTNDTASALCAGDYEVYVTDSQNCLDSSSCQTVNSPLPLSGTTTATDATCNGVCDGTATVNPAGGTGPYSVVWYNCSTGIPIGQTTTTATSLCAGDYQAEITDANNCVTMTACQTVVEPNTLSGTLTPQNITCNGICDGQISSLITGGTPSYTYQWIDCGTGSPIPGETNPTIIGLCVGNYQLEITDANSCVSTTTCSAIAQPTLITYTLDNVQDATCGGVCDGTIDITVSGGVGPYTFNWLDCSTSTPIGNTNEDPTGLCLGIYCVEITDANGCVITSSSITVNEVGGPTGIVTTVDATCFGFCNGSASSVVSGGVSPYIYDWQGITPPLGSIGSGISISGLCAGDYSFSVTDVNGCSGSLALFTITEASYLNVNTDSTVVTCFGACDGTATVTPIGGTSPYTYSWSPAPCGSAGNISSVTVGVGTWSVTVIDAMGCQSDTVVDVTGPTVLFTTINGTDPICNGGCDGIVNVNVSGGTGSYSYVWYDCSTGLPIGQTTPSAVGLCAGSYQAEITDGVGCMVTSSCYTLNDPSAISVSASVGADNLCNGYCNGIINSVVSGGTIPYTYDWIDCSTSSSIGQTSANATNLCAGDYQLSLTDNNGCNVITACETITEPSLFDVTVTTTDVACYGDCNGTATATVSGGTGPYTLSWNSSVPQSGNPAVNLCAGNYNLTVTDINGCDTIIPFSILQNSPISSVLTGINPSCNGVCDGSVTILPLGGVGPYSIDWYDQATGTSISQPTPTATNLCDGIYYAVVADALGCPYTSENDTITEPGPIVITEAINNNATCNVCDGSASVTITGGSLPYSIQWYDTGGLPIAGGNALAQIGLCAGVNTVEVTDFSLCVASLPITITNIGAELVTTSTTPSSCFSSCDGTASYTFDLGTCQDAPCTTQWYDVVPTPVGTSNPQTNLCDGIYILEVTNASGCVTVEQDTITAPTQILPNEIVIMASCGGTCDGDILLAPSGGTPGYTYSWSPTPPVGDGTDHGSSLCAGTYVITISDGNACDTILTIVITEPTPLDVTNIQETDITCFGANDGTTTVNVSGGTPTYTYDWIDCSTLTSIGQTTQSATGLGGGSYQVAVQDAMGCTATTVCVSVAEPLAISGTFTATNNSCFGVCDGSIAIVAAGGTGAYSYQWNLDGLPLVGETGASVVNACAGIYTVDVSDANSCSITLGPDTLTEPAPYSVASNSTNLTCYGSCDGIANIIVSGGGTPAYTYIWSPSPGSGDSTANPSAMCAGTYTLLLSDANSCDTTFDVVITQPNPLYAGISITNISCNLSCDGELLSNTTGGNTPYTYNWGPDPITGDGTNNVTGLCDGTYTLSIYDANSCNVDTTIILVEPTLITATIITNPSACGACDGSASVTPSGGSSPYIYQWYDTGGALLGTNQFQANLCAGVNTVDVTDNNGCTQTFIAGISDIGAEVITADSVDVTCFGDCDGQLIGVIVGGCGATPCTEEWYDATPSLVGTGGTLLTMCPGTYAYQVTNGSGCITTEVTDINEPGEILDSVGITQPTCGGFCDGAIDVSISGGDGNYTYSWSPVPCGGGQGTPNVIVNAGIYTLTVTDGNGCSGVFSYTVNEPGAVITVNSVTDVSCSYTCDGAIDVTVLGGTLPYTYVWNPAPIQTTEDLSNACSGSYILQVTDGNGCLTYKDTVIGTLTPISATTVTIDATCDLCDGSATATPSGGSGSYTYLWSDGGAQTSQTATNLCPGVYDLLVTDSAGCTNTFSVNVGSVGGPSGTTLNTTPTTCFGTCDGAADVTPLGGTAPFTYYWIHDGTTLNSEVNLCSGLYYVEITDSNNCVYVQDVTIISPTEITDSTYIVPATCGLSDGSILITPLGGDGGPYTFVWCHGPTTPLATGLAEGFYCVTVTDGSGCTQLFNYQVPGATAPSAVVVGMDANCNGVCDGSATLTITGGSGPFTSIWMDATGVPIGQTGLTATALCAGDYTVEIQDAVGCTAFGSVTISEPNSITFSLPYVQNISCAGVCDGLATAIAMGGALPYTYSWTIIPDPATADVTNVCAGTYDVTITDATGCTNTQTVTLTEPIALSLAFDTIIPALCETQCDGAVNMTVTGGTTPYNYSWTGPNSFTSSLEDLTALCPGDHIISITDTNGCSIVDTATIIPLVIILSNAGTDTSICENDCITLTGVGSGSASLSYQWEDISGALLSSTTTNTICPALGITQYVFCVNDAGCYDCDTIDVTVAPLPLADAGNDFIAPQGAQVNIGGSPTGPAGSSYSWTPSSGMLVGDSIVSNPGLIVIDSVIVYVVTVTSVDGCIASDSIQVTGIPQIIFPNGITPNGDGFNDVWIIDYIDQFPDNSVEVYNRWGELLMLESPYLNDWNGSYNGNPLPVGTYYYVINLHSVDYPEVYTGPITIMR